MKSNTYIQTRISSRIHLRTKQPRIFCNTPRSCRSRHDSTLSRTHK